MGRSPSARITNMASYCKMKLNLMFGTFYSVRNLKKKSITIATSLLLGTLLVLVYLKEPKSSFIHNYVNDTLEELQVNAEYEDVFAPPPKCEKNKTMEKVLNFDSLNPQIQDFLYYRHCRSFPMILDLPHKCGRRNKPKDIFLLLVIKSPPKNYEQREVLRKTWAKDRLHMGKSIKTIFISGTDGSGFEKERLNKLLALENKEYRDILQWDFNESFFNLTLKQILFLEWMDKRCRNARFLLNGDDDVFAHTENMIVYLQSLEDNDGTKHLFTGHMIQNALPIRWQNSKYFVPVQVYDKTLYPAYCGGGGYLMSGYTALVIYEMSKSIEVLPIDDVYMGMCLAAAELKPNSHIGVKTLGWYIPSKALDKYDPCYMKEVLLIHKFSPGSIYVMWHEVHNPKLKCGLTMLRW